MSRHEERQNKTQEAVKLIKEIASIDPASLSRREELSRDINFEEAVPFFTEMIDIIKELSQRDISRLSTNQINHIISSCNHLNQLIQEVHGFTLNQNTPADVCNGIIKEIMDSYDNVMEPLLLPLAFTATQATDYAKIEREAKGYYATIKKELMILILYLFNIKKMQKKL